MKSLFYSPQKIKHEASDILFWGCMHIHHDPKWAIPIWKQRGYNSSQEHDAGLISNWNKKASDSTIGFLLGDNMFGAGGAREFESVIGQLKFQTLYVMPGNHYAGWHQSFESVDQNILWIKTKQVIFCPNYLEMIINGQSVVSSHYPVLSFNGQARGSFMLFSHVHGNLEKSDVGRAYLNSKCRAYEVSVEKNPSPPSFKEISEILKKREPVSFDHHDSSTQNPF